MKYISTRGIVTPISFKETVMMGLATDGGLLLPEVIPSVGETELSAWRALSYQELALAVFSLFIHDLPPEEIKKLIDRSYASFTHPFITPVFRKGAIFILELFHGPTLAFKDVALQFLGNLFADLLAETGAKMNILGATSGDTGSAAICGVRGKERINIFIIHPHKRVSLIQELQMTTVTDPNVFNIAIRGTFDDGQAVVKEIFNDLSFKQQYSLGSVNSINWARVLAQVVYYIYAWLKISPEGHSNVVDFSVPTGNFGDIFAGYIARRMIGPGIRRLVLATNENDLLARFVIQGEYRLGTVKQTSSPSMDIQVASNFERYLYYLYGEDPRMVREDMKRFAASGSLSFPKELMKRVQSDFAAKSVSEPETIATIKAFYQEHGYILDPHTAVGVKAGLTFRQEGVPMICLATAHPAKFGAAVKLAIGKEPELPLSLAELTHRPSRCEILDAQPEAIKRFIADHAQRTQ